MSEILSLSFNGENIQGQFHRRQTALLQKLKFFFSTSRYTQILANLDPFFATLNQIERRTHNNGEHSEKLDVHWTSLLHRGPNCCHVWQSSYKEKGKHKH